MIVISFNVYLFIYFSVKHAIQSNDCDVFVNKQSILFYSILFYSEINWVFPRLPFGIVAYAFTLFLDNLCRNSCI